MDLNKYIRDVPDWPKKGIVFKDITTLLKDPAAFSTASAMILEELKKYNITKVAAIESRGFIMGGILAAGLNAGFVPIRKPNKLPAEKLSVSYDLEYGKDTLEIHKDAIVEGDLVVLHDDVLATGGTAAAAVSLIEQLGGKVVLLSFIIELSFLNGREKLSGHKIHSLLNY